MDCVSRVSRISDSNGWAEGSYFYVLSNGVEHMRGTLTGMTAKELTLSRADFSPALTYSGLPHPQRHCVEIHDH